MKAIRFILAVIVFLFFAVYLLSLETGRKFPPNWIRLVPQGQKQPAITIKPSPIERLRAATGVNKDD